VSCRSANKSESTIWFLDNENGKTHDRYTIRSLFAHVLVCDDTGISAKEDPGTSRMWLLSRWISSVCTDTESFVSMVVAVLFRVEQLSTPTRDGSERVCLLQAS
jgi:hypothetical protein